MNDADKDSNQSKGSAFVKFVDASCVQEVVKHCNQDNIAVTVNGRLVRVDVAVDKKSAQNFSNQVTTELIP
jgi:hypothetical protein